MFVWMKLSRSFFSRPLWLTIKRLIYRLVNSDGYLRIWSRTELSRTIICVSWHRVFRTGATMNIFRSKVFYLVRDCRFTLLAVLTTEQEKSSYWSVKIIWFIIEICRMLLFYSSNRRVSLIIYMQIIRWSEYSKSFIFKDLEVYYFVTSVNIATSGTSRRVCWK